MGSSFVHFRGQGFWVRDPTIEVLVFLLLQEDARDNRLGERAPDLVGRWKIQAQVDFAGWHDLHLDELAEDQQTREIILALLARIEARSDTVTSKTLEQAGVATWTSARPWKHDVPVTALHATGHQLARLLRGEISSRAGDPDALGSGMERWWLSPPEEP